MPVHSHAHLLYVVQLERIINQLHCIQEWWKVWHDYGFLASETVEAENTLQEKQTGEILMQVHL